MANLQTLLDQKAELDKKIAVLRHEAHASAIAEIRALMASHGLTIDDVVGKSAAGKAKVTGSKVAAKYCDRMSGKTWSGRGLQPNWLKAALAAGKKLEDYRV